MREQAGFLLFSASCSALAFALGGTVVELRIFPYDALRSSFEQVADFGRHWKNDLGIEPTRYLVAEPPQMASDDALADGTLAGLRLVVGYFEDRATTNGALLLDDRNNELHFWPIEPRRISAAVDDAFVDGHHPFLHGFEVLGDGSIVVNFDDGNVLARLDACGAVIWAVAGRFHHSIDLADDGSLWVSGEPTPLARKQTFSQVDPRDGSVLWSGHLEDISNRFDNKGVFAIRRSDDAEPYWLDDPFHLNDVEVLPRALAPRFPLFEPGDLMLSLRSLNLIVVLDRDTLEAKWWQHGPWHRQHDPDFLPNGKISLLDNDMHGETSRILEIDPVTRAIDVVFEGSARTPFHTPIRGKHQRLANGNVLIAEAQMGRAFEINRAGDVVWEYQNRIDGDRNLLISDAVWLPRDFFGRDLPTCGDETFVGDDRAPERPATRAGRGRAALGAPTAPRT